MKKEMNSQTTLLDRLIALCDEDKDGEALLEVAVPASSIQPMRMNGLNDAQPLL